jgi:hypothetical protein
MYFPLFQFSEQIYWGNALLKEGMYITAIVHISTIYHGYIAQKNKLKK